MLWREEEGGWSSTQLELGEKSVFRQCVLEKKTNSLCIVGSLTPKGLRACVKNVQVHKGATELRNGKQMCLGMRTRYECGEMW